MCVRIALMRVQFEREKHKERREELLHLDLRATTHRLAGRPMTDRSSHILTPSSLALGSSLQLLRDKLKYKFILFKHVNCFPTLKWQTNLHGKALLSTWTSQVRSVTLDVVMVMWQKLTYLIKPSLPCAFPLCLPSLARNTGKLSGGCQWGCHTWPACHACITYIDLH